MVVEKEIQVSSVAPAFPGRTEWQEGDKEQGSAGDPESESDAGHTGHYIYTDDLSEFAVTESQTGSFLGGCIQAETGCCWQ